MIDAFIIGHFPSNGQSTEPVTISTMPLTNGKIITIQMGTEFFIRGEISQLPTNYTASIYLKDSDTQQIIREVEVVKYAGRNLAYFNLNDIKPTKFKTEYYLKMSFGNYNQEIHFTLYDFLQKRFIPEEKPYTPPATEEKPYTPPATEEKPYTPPATKSGSVDLLGSVKDFITERVGAIDALKIFLTPAWASVARYLPSWSEQIEDGLRVGGTEGKKILDKVWKEISTFTKEKVEEAQDAAEAVTWQVITEGITKAVRPHLPKIIIGISIFALIMILIISGPRIIGHVATGVTKSIIGRKK